MKCWFEEMVVHYWVLLIIVAILAYGVYFLDHRVRALEYWTDCRPHSSQLGRDQWCEPLNPIPTPP